MESAKFMNTSIIQQARLEWVRFQVATGKGGNGMKKRQSQVQCKEEQTKNNQSAGGLMANGWIRGCDGCVIGKRYGIGKIFKHFRYRMGLVGIDLIGSCNRKGGNHEKQS